MQKVKVYLHEKSHVVSVHPYGCCLWQKWLFLVDYTMQLAFFKLCFDDKLHGALQLLISYGDIDLM